MKETENSQVVGLQKLTEKKIKEFAGNVIFRRGHDYFIDGLVEDFELDPVKNVIRASIHGSIGVYSIEVWERNDEIDADCDCPFDGHPCKHIVAVLLYYLHNKDSYLKNLDKEQKNETLVKEKLFSLEKDELIKIILSFVKKYPSIKRELFLQLAIGKESTLKQFFKEIDKVLRVFELNTFSTYEISHQLKEIIKQAAPADSELKGEILWKITDGVLYQLNEFGMDDTPLENIAIESMDLLVQTLNSEPGLDKRRIEIHAELEEYCGWKNCGIVDNICEAAFEISDDNN